MESPKYPRTFHLPWSAGCTNDDKRQDDVAGLLGCDIVITEKMDGSNVCMEHDACFARTHSGPPNHPSFDAFKQLHAQVKFFIPKSVQVCGEWLYALHSIKYESLPSYFMTFGIRNVKDMYWEGWDMVEMWADELHVDTVPVLDKTKITSAKALLDLCDKHMKEPSRCGGEREGLVIRTAKGYSTDDFSKNILKIVRADHVQTTEHWKNQEITRNGLMKRYSSS